MEGAFLPLNLEDLVFGHECKTFPSLHGELVPSILGLDRPFLGSGRQSLHYGTSKAFPLLIEGLVF